FENRKKIFPIDSRYKFVSLVFRKGRPEGDGFEAAFMRHDLVELEATARYREPGQEKVAPFAAPWIVPVRRQELERLSPGTLAFLEYRSPRDREILLKMYGYDAEGNRVNPRPLLGDQGPGTWNARFYREFDMTNDRDLWTDPKTGRLYNPRQILGPVPGTSDRPPYYDPAAWPEIRARMAEKGFWPLYEGKHIEQFLVDIKPIERWVSLEACQRKYGRLPEAGPKLVFRDIASNTNERTCIAAVLPERSCANNKLPVVAVPVSFSDQACSVLNSFAFDFALRFRISSTLNFTHVSRVAVPRFDVAESLLSLKTFTVAGTDIDHVSAFEEKWHALLEVNRAVAEAYGLAPDDLKHILATFPVFARKRPGFYSYLQEQLKDWKEEAGCTEAHVYTVPAAGDLSVAAEPRGTYFARVQQRSGGPSEATLPFKQAAIFAWVVNALYSPGYAVSRYRAGKMLYLIERATQSGLFRGFLKQAAGPYDPRLRYKGPEDIAVRQHRWLVA
ncbi:MAG: type I restriction endonuclease subunit M, partial [Bacillota bacterium]|nr:type I restriction endonuclease subunit M [Bacillota bacterium]